MQGRSTSKDSRSRRNTTESRGRRRVHGERETNGKLSEDNKSRITPADIAMEALEVEAILAGRPNPKNSSQWGQWTAIIALEVVVFVWFKWASEIYTAYKAANP